MQDDVTDGVQALIERGTVDAKRVCIAGASYGGYAALAGAAFTPERYACAISINGVSDLPAMLGHALKYGGDESNAVAYWRDHIGDPYDPKVAAASPNRSADKVRAPILLIHGIDDTVVPISQSEAMDRALGAVGKQRTFIKIKGEDHWLSGNATRIEVLKQIETFLAAHLQTP